MEQIVNDHEWEEAWLDTPFGVPDKRYQAAGHPDDLLDCPGVHLKSHELEDSWPKYYGRLTSFSPEEVLVISKVVMNGDVRCVWKGTEDEYRKMWMVD
jgi:hypothetical protein